MQLSNAIRLWWVLIRFVVWQGFVRVNLMERLKITRKHCIMIRRILPYGIIWHYLISRRKIMMLRKRIWKVCWKYLRVIPALIWWGGKCPCNRKIRLLLWTTSIRLLNWINMIRMLGLQERLLNYNRLSMRKRKRISTVLFRWVLRMLEII